MTSLYFNLQETLSAFVVLFAVIDITGLLPVLIDFHNKGMKVSAPKAAIFSLITFIVFLFAGEALLQLFQVDISSFAIAGSFVLFVMAIEMVLGVQIFRNDGPEGTTTLVPIVFPLIAGAGSFTTLLSLRALYSLPNIIIALLLNIVIVYLAIRFSTKIERILGKAFVYVLRKFFGVILLAISVRMFVSNFAKLMEMFGE
ncbi:MAG: MarC family protein [Coprobacter sp.]|nr:MarC family protein [Coprobacter sp.]